MLVNILDSIFAEVIPGTRLYGAPRWMLRGHTVLVGPSHSAEEHEQHVLQTIGSADWMWSGSDELRFDRKNLLLQSVQFNVPERQVDTSPLLLAWQTARQVDGQLRLTAAQGFQVNIADVRWLDSSGETLICLAEEALVTDQERWRLRVAQDLDLLLSQEKWSGFALWHPARYLVKAWEEPALEEGSDEELAKLLYDYCTLVTDQCVDLMEDGDAAIREKLVALYRRIIAPPHWSAQRHVLRHAVEDVLERFYSRQRDGQGTEEFFS